MLLMHTILPQCIAQKKKESVHCQRQLKQIVTETPEKQKQKLTAELENNLLYNWIYLCSLVGKKYSCRVMELL